MAAFLLTWKESGWPYSNIQQMLAKFDSQGFVNASWRLRAHKLAKQGDSVWLLKQGNGPKVIFGKGVITGPLKRDSNYGKWFAPVRFHEFVDPKTAQLVDHDTVVKLLRPSQIAAQASGDPLTAEQDAALSQLVTQRSQAIQPKSRQEKRTGNPDWVRDELILALDIYLQNRTNLPAKESKVIHDLSQSLQRLGAMLFHSDLRSVTFRNAAGVYMKLMNFRRLDPQFTSKGLVGLSRGAKGEEDVWKEFSSDPKKCHSVANAIRAALSSQEFDEEEYDDGFEDAPEGRLLTKQHVSRERSRKLVAKKISQVKKAHGKLNCEVCKFNFTERYGSRGEDVIECHHKKPVSMLKSGEKTKLDDLALVCANCHRIIHRSRPWLSLDELRGILVKYK